MQVDERDHIAAADLRLRLPLGHRPHLNRAQPIGVRILANTLAQRLLYLGGDQMQPLRDVFAELLAYGEVQRHLVGMVTGLDIRYDAGPGDHPLLGRRLPDQDLLIGERKTTTYQLLHAGRALLLDLDDDPDLRRTASAWADRVDTVTATRHDPALPSASLLVRPDGYIAWVSAGGSGADGLATALTRWFGQPRKDVEIAAPAQARTA